MYCNPGMADETVGAPCPIDVDTAAPVYRQKVLLGATTEALCTCRVKSPSI